MKPTLVVLIGLPGSGKTTLAKWLSRHSDLAVVSRDVIRAAMFPQCRYTMEEKVAAFDAMRAAIDVSLSHGSSVCTDGITFASASDRAAVAAIAADHGARLQLVWCDVSISIARERVAADELTTFPDRNSALVSAVATRFDPVPQGAVRLDMTEPVVSLGNQLLRILEA